ncbi:hypothetical protein BDW62DRAFT_204637 [Aspergillus aurantiobrunneus]
MISQNLSARRPTGPDDEKTLVLVLYKIALRIKCQLRNGKAEAKMETATAHIERRLDSGVVDVSDGGHSALSPIREHEPESASNDRPPGVTELDTKRTNSNSKSRQESTAKTNSKPGLKIWSDNPTNFHRKWLNVA